MLKKQSLSFPEQNLKEKRIKSIGESLHLQDNGAQMG